MFPKIGGKTPKWMVKIMENPIKMDDLGVYTIIFGNIHIREKLAEEDVLLGNLL